MRNINCKIRTNNTADSRCRLDLGLYRRIILTPMNAVFIGLDAHGEEQSFENWIMEGIHSSNPSSRFYPLPEVRGIEDSSKDEGIFTDPYGEDTPLFEGAFGFSQKFRPDACLNRRLFAFNNQQFRVIIVDNQNNAQMIRTSLGLSGELMRVFVTSPKANTESEISLPTIKFAATQAEEHQKREVVSTELSWGELKGLEDFNIKIIKSEDRWLITFDVSCSGDDVTGELMAISGQKDAWVPELTEAPVYNAELNAFEVSNLTVGSKIGLSNPSVLFSFGVSNVECSQKVEVI